MESMGIVALSEVRLKDLDLRESCIRGFLHYLNVAIRLTLSGT